MLNPKSVAFIVQSLRLYPWRTALLVGLLILSGVAEGVGLITMLPLLELAVGGEAQGSSRLTESVTHALASLGLAPSLGVLLGLIVVGICLKAGFLWLASCQVGYTVARITTDFRLRLLRALLGARWSYFTSQPVGRFSNAVGLEAYWASFAYRAACALLADSVQALIYICVALLVSWQLALLGVAVGALMILLLRGFVEMSRTAGRQQNELINSLVSRLTDSLRGIKGIKAMGRERHLWPLLERDAHELNRAQRRTILAAETLRLFQEPLMVLFVAVGLFVVLSLGSHPFSTILLLVFLFSRLMGRIHLVQTDYQSMVTSEATYWSLRGSIEEAEREQEGRSGHRPPPPLRTDLVLDAVGFAHGEQPTLRDVSVRIAAGEFVALVGPSGAGKTTLVDLIMGLVLPRAGEVRVDGVPLGEIDLTAWRQTIGYVPQEMFLFHDTIRRNVTLGDDGVSPQEVEQALRMAGVWSCVEELPEGADTVIGEAGSKLSGGQRQRIVIARALVHRPRLLVLDEATTALDPATERSICETLRELRGHVTILAITHQAALREAADRVLLVERGMVREATALSHYTAAAGRVGGVHEAIA